jgi:hypothetical protein
MTVSRSLRHMVREAVNRTLCANGGWLLESQERGHSRR